MNRRFRDERNVLRLEVDVDAFPLVDLRDCHALIEEGCGTTRPFHSYIQTTSQDQTEPARHNNLTTRSPHLHGLALCHGNILGCRDTLGRSRQDIHSTRVPLRRKAVDGPSHHWHTLDVGDEQTSLTGMVAEHRSATHSPQQRLHFLLRPSVNTALVMRSRWKRWIKVVSVCHTPELLQTRKPRRSYASTCCHYRRIVSR